MIIYHGIFRDFNRVISGSYHGFIRVLIKVIELFVDKVVERVYSYRWIRG